MKTRRQWMADSAKVAGLMVAAGVWPLAAQAAWPQAAFDAKSIADVVKALGGASAPTESKEVTLTGPDIAENGAVVPVGMSTTLPNVKKMAVLVEKNPYTLAASFDVTDGIEPNIQTRVKMGQSSMVYAVAITADNKVHYAAKEIKVTLGGCGG